MNKPSKATISDLKGALDDLESVLNFHLREGAPGRAAVLTAGDKVKRALSQLTEDGKLPCPHTNRGCRIVKPTKRAVSAHATQCLYKDRPVRA